MKTIAPREDQPAISEKLLDGKQYIASLQDARSVHLEGECIADVTVHPAFRNSCRSIARLYDALHDPQKKDTLTAVDHLNQRTHKFFKPSRSAQELVEAREAIVAWARSSSGWPFCA